MEKKSTPGVRHRRKQLRAQRKGFADIAEQNEGVVYVAGLFSLFWNAHFNTDNVFFWIYQYFSMEQYIFILKTSLFIYIVLFKNDDIFKKYDVQKIL